MYPLLTDNKVFFSQFVVSLYAANRCEKKIQRYKIGPVGIVIERKEADHNRRGTFSALQSLLIPYELCIRLTETLLRINRIFLSLVSLEEGGGERKRDKTIDFFFFSN